MNTLKMMVVVLASIKKMTLLGFQSTALIVLSQSFLSRGTGCVEQLEKIESLMADQKISLLGPD